MKLHTKQLTLAALTAAAYAVLSYFGSIFGITYGPIQCRFSEALCVLPFFLPETAWGLGVGCYGLGGLLLWRLDKSNALQRYLQNR